MRHLPLPKIILDPSLLVFLDTLHNNSLAILRDNTFPGQVSLRKIDGRCRKVATKIMIGGGGGVTAIPAYARLAPKSSYQPRVLSQ